MPFSGSPIQNAQLELVAVGAEGLQQRGGRRLGQHARHASARASASSGIAGVDVAVVGDLHGQRVATAARR